MASDEHERFEMLNPATGDNTNGSAENNIPIKHTTDDDDHVEGRATEGNAVTHRDSDGKTTSALPASSSTSLDPEKLHILLTYSTLLALSRDTSRPVVDLDMEAQVRQLDAFLAGDVTEDGVATHWSTRSQSSKRLRQYEEMCNKLVPNLTAAIKKQSQANLNLEPKNRVKGEKNPEHRSFYELYLTANLVIMYGKVIQKLRKKGMLSNSDIDSWADMVKYDKLIQLFQTIYGHQYDLEGWKHTRPGLQPGAPPRIRVYHCVVTPLGKVFSQLDTIPEIATNYTDDQLAKIWRDKTRPKYLIPDPASVTIPAKRRDMAWVNDDGVGKAWTRGETSWSTKFKFMVFDKGTNAYIHDHVIDVDLLDQIDLNDETWVKRYRKKIVQWRSRATREVTRARDSWTDEERILVYQFLNSWIKANGIDKFVLRIWDNEKHGLVNTLVNKTGRARTAESVSAWAKRQMIDKPNEPLGLLYAEGQKIATRVDAGELVPEDERYPDGAIDIEGFLAKTQPKESSVHNEDERDHGRKRKYDSGSESASDDEVMSEPDDCNLDEDSDQGVDLAVETGDSDFHGDDPPPPSSHRLSKRPRLTTKDSKGFRGDDDKQEATFAKSRPLTKAEMDARTAKHDAEAAEFEAENGDDDEDEFKMNLD